LIERFREGEEAPLDARSEVRRYNSYFSGQPRTVWERLRDAPQFIAHLWNDFWTGRFIDRIIR
jgi:hypothetical protein